jgi:outer membrane lipoprotein carrier protein
MKKLPYTVVLLCIVNFAFAQYDPAALVILDAMSKKYKEIPAFETNFSYTLTNESDKINEEFKGKMTVKGDKYKLELPEQEVTNNGTTVWTYLPESNEVTIDDADQSTDEVNPSRIYFIYKKGYKYLYMGEQTEGGNVCDMIDLVPEKKDAQYFKIKMAISKKDKSIVNFTIFDKQGNRFKYTITKFTPNAKVDDAFFTFDVKKHPKVSQTKLN